MREILARVAGEECRGWFLESPSEVREFRAWVERHATRGTRIAVDTEATGADPYEPGFRVRLVQFGTGHDGWVVPVERGEVFWEAVKWAFATLPRLTLHNYTFDILALERFGAVKLEDIYGRIIDTQILAHLIDSRPRDEGGVGLGLKDIAAHYVDPRAEDAKDALIRVFRSSGYPKQGRRETGWSRIPIDHPIYLRYALLDVLYTSRVLPKLREECRALGLSRDLARYEHTIARIGATVQRTGMPLDVPYTVRLRDALVAERNHYDEVARRYGVTSVHSSRQVAAALIGMGEVLTERTESGEWSTAKEVLLPLADLDSRWERIGARTPNPLADAVLRSKRAGKWATAYADAMLSKVDERGRIHPTINTLGARTARWSVSDPALQQLPSSDWRIRRCVAAPDGWAIFACDLAQVELRVLAALAEATRVVERINRGEDLHNLTTRLVYDIGDEVSDKDLKNDPRRKLCKKISLGKAYAGGADALARDTGLPLEQVKAALQKYDAALPEFARYSRWLQEDAYRYGMSVVTPSGRLVRLDRSKVYTAVAYMCQSSARDVLGSALIAADERGLTPYIIGVIHDEILCMGPASEAEALSRELKECMTMDFKGVAITADAEVYGLSWGHGYGATE